MLVLIGVSRLLEFIDTKNEDQKRVSVNGDIGEHSYITVGRNRKLWGFIYEDFIVNYFVKQNFSELSDSFEIFHFVLGSDDFDGFNIDIYTEESHRRNDVIQLSLIINFEDWKSPYSISELAHTIKECALLNTRADIRFHQEDEEYVTNGFGLELLVLDRNIAIEDAVNDLLLYTKQMLLKAKKVLAESHGIFSMVFNFPDGIKAPCEQYLMYFSQFLNDLGIKATNELTHQNGITLFSVVPESKDQALEVISDALATYLSLPEELSFHTENLQHKDIAVMQLESNVMHLKSQLMLAQSILQAKDATIQSLTLSNRQYQDLIPEKNNSSTEENVIGEVVKVKEYDGKVVSVDLPRILRNLKRMLK